MGGPWFSEKYGPPGPIFFKKLVLGPKFLPDQNFRDSTILFDGQGYFPTTYHAPAGFDKRSFAAAHAAKD